MSQKYSAGKNGIKNVKIEVKYNDADKVIKLLEALQINFGLDDEVCE